MIAAGPYWAPSLAEAPEGIRAAVEAARQFSSDLKPITKQTTYYPWDKG